MSFDFSKLNNLKKNELYRDEYYYKINEEKQREQQKENNNYSKNNSIWDDVKNTFNNLMLGGKQGATQMFKGAETQLESNKNYKMSNERQFYNSRNVSDIVKAQAKSENSNDLLNSMIKKKINNNYENTIMDKNVPLKLDDENIKKELEKYKNSISNGKMDTNLTRNFLQNSIDKTSEEIQQNTDNIKNKVLRKANEQIVPALGQMGAGMVASAINPALGTLYFTESATGSYYDDAKERGMDDNEARKYSTIMGAMEGATEQIGIENLSKAGKGIKTLVKGTGKEAVKQGTKEITKSGIKTVLKNYGIGIADNIMQEAIIDPIQELTAQTIAGKDKAQWEGIGQRMLQDGINGGLVSAILGGANLGIQSCTGIVEKMQSNRTVTQQELQTAVKDAGQQLDTSKIMMDSVEQQVNKYKDYYTGKQLDSNTQDALNQAQNIINNNQNLQQNLTQNQFNSQEQQIIATKNKNAQNENTEQINNIANNQETLYNNAKESESGYNERNNGQTIGRNDETTRLYEESKPQQKQYTRTENIGENEQGRAERVFSTNEGRQGNDRKYQTNNEGQQEIDYIRDNRNYITDLNSNQKRIENRYKDIGVPVKFYSFDSRTGGRYNDGTLYINTYNMTDEQQANVAVHEYAHSLLRDNVNFQNEVSSIADKIISSENEGRTEAIRNYIMDRDENITTDEINKVYEIALEEILADYMIDIDNNVDFNNNNQYGIDIEILDEYKNLAQKYLPKKTEKTYRTSEQIANDSKISDLDAIREETKNINTPEIDEVENLQNELRENSVENSPTIDYIKEKRSKEKVSIKEIKNTLAQKFVNKGHYIDKLAEKTGNKNLTYLYDRTMNTFNESQISIGDNQINSKGEVVGKSIIDIFQPSQDMNVSKEFEDYLLNKHNISRYAHEKGIFGKEISATDSQNIVNSYEKKYPQFKEWAKDVSKYNDNNIKDLVNNGLVSETTYKRLKEMYGDYVPTFRDITDNISQYEDNRVGGNAIKRATESNLDILSVKESMAEQTLAIKKAIRINNLGIELYKTLGKDSTISTGIDFDAVAMQTIAGNVIESEGKGKNTFTIFKDGEMTQFKISDELYSAFSKDTLQNKINNSKTAKTLLTPIENMSKAQRELLTTYSVGFAMNNPIKDFQDALFNSKYNGATFVKNWTKALYNIATDGSWYQSYKNNGGTANTYFDYNKGILPTKTKNLIKKFVNKIKDANEVLEQAPRLAEYISTIEHKGSIDEALYNAADITTNFKRGGDITKAINKYGANFLNASVQGLDKVYRNVSGKNGWKGYANLMLKATAYQIAPAIINGILLGDDDDYDDLPDYTKDNYFLFKLDDGKFFRIPKGRLSSVIGGIARRTLETAQGKEVDWNSVVDTTINQLAPNNPLTNNVIAPITQAISNKSWFGGDIVNTRLQKLPISEQYDESTDKLSKFLGEHLNISPKKINYVLEQYSGGIGDVVLPMITPQAENNILEDKFTTDSVMKNKNVSEYYSKTEELEKIKNSLNAADEDKLKYKYFTNSSSDISDLYKQKREIQNSNISDKDKKEQVRNIQKQINDIVENKLSNVDNLEKSDKYATIDDSQYYKDAKENWNELSEEEKEKNKNFNISLKNYSDYKYQISKLKQEKIDNGELKESGQLKDKDKIQILIDSNYSKEEKENIYKNYINSTDKKTILVDKLGLPINEYLKYKTKTFENDKDSDGETISGSKKKKVYTYLNSISDKELSQDYKKIICKIEDINDYDNDIVNFVNNSKQLSYSDKTEILKNIGFKIDKDGKIQTKSILPIYKYVK